MQFTTAMISPHAAPEPVSQVDINALLRGRKFGAGKDDLPLDMNPPIPECDPSELAELQDFCSKRGIVGVNFNGMKPAAVLRMLKAKMGITEQVNNRGILHG